MEEEIEQQCHCGMLEHIDKKNTGFNLVLCDWYTKS